MTEPDGRTVVEVHQRVLDKDGNTLLEGTVQHVYKVRDGLIWHMEIRAPTEDANSQGYREQGRVFGSGIGRLPVDKLRVRDAWESDLPEIVEIYNSTIPSRMVSADTEPVTVEQRTAWFREHDPRRRPLWVAEVDGRVIGWLSLGDFWDGRPAYHATAEVGIYVKDGYRGGGVGRRLIEEAIGRAPELGIETITAGAFAHNGPSVKLFEHFGFERWAHFPEVAELDGVKRDLVVLGLGVG